MWTNKRQRGGVRRGDMRGGFVIGGKEFDPDRDDQIIELGAVEEWTVVTDSPLVHPFHLHVNPVQVALVNRVPVQDTGHRDTISVDPSGGSFTFRTVLRGLPRLARSATATSSRADLGMMAVFHVLRPDEDPRGVPAPRPVEDPRTVPAPLCGL